jgi:hypothetical protein
VHIVEYADPTSGALVAVEVVVGTTEAAAPIDREAPRP